MTKPWKGDKKTMALVEQAEKAKREGSEDSLKELKKQLKKVASICGAVKGNGKVCTRQPYKKEDGSTNGKCASHGGKSTGIKTKEGRARQMAKFDPKFSYKHGAYSKNLENELTQEEADFYNGFMSWYLETYPEDVDPVNVGLVHRLIINTIKQERRDSHNFMADTPSYNDVEAKMIKLAESLGLNRKFKKSNSNAGNVQQIGIAGLFLNENEDE